MQLEGNVQSGELRSVLLHIAQEKLTGILELGLKDASTDGPSGYIFFETGKILTCLQQDRLINLANELVENQVLSVSQIQELLIDAREQDKRLEKLLVEKNILEPNKLRQAYEKILCQRLCEFVQAADISFSFKSRAGDRLDLGLPDLALPNEELFLPEGADVSSLLDQMKDLLTTKATSGSAETPDPFAEFLASAAEPLEVQRSIPGKLALLPETKEEAKAGGTETNNDYVNWTADLGSEGHEVKNLPPDDLGFLRTLLNELNDLGYNSFESGNAEHKTDLTILVMRYAGQAFQRAVLFRIDDPYIRSIAEFGFEQKYPRHAHELRLMKFRKGSKGFFSLALQTKMLLHETWTDEFEHDDAAFFSLMQPIAPLGFFLAPIICRDQVTALLYGDSGAGAKLELNTMGLEIFLTQVGVALEKSFLAGRIAELKNTPLT